MIGKVIGGGAAAAILGGGGIAIAKNDSARDRDRDKTNHDNMSGKAIRCRAGGDQYIPAHREGSKWVPGKCIDR